MRAKTAPTWRRLLTATRVAALLLGAAVITPPMLIAMLGPVSPIGSGLVTAASLLCAIFGSALYVVAKDRRHRRRMQEMQWSLARSAKSAEHIEQLHRRVVASDKISSDLTVLADALTQERRNLGEIANAVADVRRILGQERRNVGALANGVHELRQLQEQLALRFDDQIEPMQYLVAHAEASKVELGVLTDQIAKERSNLGLVAGGLDNVRRAATGIEAIGARQASLEDLIVTLSDHMDELEKRVGVASIPQRSEPPLSTRVSKPSDRIASQGA